MSPCNVIAEIMFARNGGDLKVMNSYDFYFLYYIAIFIIVILLSRHAGVTFMRLEDCRALRMRMRSLLI